MPEKQSKRNDLQKNLMLYYGAVGVIILGYIFLSIGDANSLTSLTIGPIVLVLGYLVAMPIALLTGLGKKESESKSLSGTERTVPPPINPNNK